MCSEEPNILPEESPDAQAVLNGHHHHVFMGREDRPIIGGCSAHYETTSVDPHHHLDREEAATLAVGSRAGKDLKRWSGLVTSLLTMTQGGHSPKFICPSRAGAGSHPPPHSPSWGQAAAPPSAPRLPLPVSPAPALPPPEALHPENTIMGTAKAKGVIFSLILSSASCLDPSPAQRTLPEAALVIQFH